MLKIAILDDENTFLTTVSEVVTKELNNLNVEYKIEKFLMGSILLNSNNINK